MYGLEMLTSNIKDGYLGKNLYISLRHVVSSMHGISPMYMIQRESCEAIALVS